MYLASISAIKYSQHKKSHILVVGKEMTYQTKSSHAEKRMECFILFFLSLVWFAKKRLVADDRDIEKSFECVQGESE